MDSCFGYCRSCKSEISIEAMVCPSCGAPDPFYIDKVCQVSKNFIAKLMINFGEVVFGSILLCFFASFLFLLDIRLHWFLSLFAAFIPWALIAYALFDKVRSMAREESYYSDLGMELLKNNEQRGCFVQLIQQRSKR